MLVVRMNFDKMLKLQLSYYLTLYCIYSFIVEEDCKFSHAKIVQHRRGDVSSVGRKFRDSGFVKDRNNELAESTSFEKVLIKDERKKTREISVSNKAYVESTSRLNQNASTIIDEALGNNISKLNHSHQFRNAQVSCFTQIVFVVSCITQTATLYRRWIAIEASFLRNLCCV